jgi:predicted Zn-dependent protease
VDQARKVLALWLEAIPASLQGRILKAEFAAQDGNPQAAESILMGVFVDHENDPDVIASLVSLGRRTGHLDEFIKSLEDLRKRETANVAVVQSLMEIYLSQGSTADAVRVLDEARAGNARDGDLLYQVAHLYEEVDQKQTTEEVLQQVVALDPKNSSACNDLGFTWADQGRNLDRAAALIQVAVEAEPDNQSFLDSMGWVLYKQGRYDQAAIYMQKAIGPALQPDPVVLDHFGDVLYRLGKADEAARQWQRSLTGLDEQQQTDRDDLRDLRVSLERKLSQQKLGTTVDVAPVATKE